MNEPKSHFFDNPRNVSLLMKAFYAACILLFLVDFIYHRHAVHPWENMLGFYGVFGFVACVALVLIAKEMRKLLMRDEDYYDGD